MNNIRLQTFLHHQSPGGTRFLFPLRCQTDVGPTAEQILQVPCGLAMAEKNQGVTQIQYLTIAANLSGSRDAPPTKAPSMFFFAMKSLMFPGLTDPP